MATTADTAARDSYPGAQIVNGVGRFVRKYWIPILIVVVLAFGLKMCFGGPSNADPYRTAAVDRGSITRAVSATGTLQPIVSANVGSLVSAPVKEILVDFNSRVTAGQVLARLDPITFQQRIAQAQAGVAQAQAQAAVANADYERYQTLNAAGFASAQLMNQQRAARDTARAAVAQANASLASARTDLDRATIRSPINGVVVDRQINVGQVVQSSFSSATLFTIAQDLSRLQANITVDEADIGDVREGQPVRFTVDAYPDSEFNGSVSQVRQQGVNTQGVVAYTVVVTADNPGGRLLPGMTANAEIIIEQTDNVLRLPNPALRFRPSDEKIAAQGQALMAQHGVASTTQGGGAGAPAGARGGGQGGGGGGRGGGGFGGGGFGGGGGGGGVNRMAQALELTPAQQQTAQNAVQQFTQANPPPGADASQDDRRAYFRRIRDVSMAALEPSLTPHQKELLQQMRNAPPGQRRVQVRPAVAWVLRNNKPAPVFVMLGVADDTHTDIVGGDLKQGDLVITGGGPRNPNAQTNGPRPQPGLGGGIRVRGG